MLLLLFYFFALYLGTEVLEGELRGVKLYVKALCHHTIFQKHLKSQLPYIQKSPTVVAKETYLVRLRTILKRQCPRAHLNIHYAKSQC